MQIIDLRQLTSRQLDPLLAEEALQWREELCWDYHSSTELINRHFNVFEPHVRDHLRELRRG